MTFGARDFASEVRMGAWNTADNEPIFGDGGEAMVRAKATRHVLDELAQDAHERQDAQYDVETGEAAYMLSCGHALPRWSAERLRVAGKERFCGICQAWVEKAMPR